MTATAERLTHVDEITLVRDLNAMTLHPCLQAHSDTIVLKPWIVHKIVNKFLIKNACVLMMICFKKVWLV